MSILIAGLLALSFRQSGLDDIRRLAASSDAKALIPLVRYLTDRDVSLRKPASDAIDSVVHRLSLWEHVRDSQLECVWWGPDRVRTLNDANSTDPKVRSAFILDRTYSFAQDELPDNAVVSFCGTGGSQSEWESDWPYIVKHCREEIDAMLDDPNSDRRYDLILELSPLKDRDLYLRLDGLCKMPQTLVRSRAYEAYQYYPGEHSIEQMIEGTYDHSAEVRCRSLCGLREADPDQACLRAVSMIDEPVVHEPDYVADTVAMAKSEKVIEALSPLLHSGDPRQTDAAEDALAHIGTQRSIDLLSSIVRDKDRSDRKYALDCLGRSPESIVFETIMDCLSDSDLVKTACDILGQRKDVRALPKLLELTKSANKQIKAAATQALNDICGTLPPPP